MTPPIDLPAEYYQHKECDKALLENRIDDACDGCKQHIWTAAAPQAETPNISLCTGCYCMTHTVDGACGKCGAEKPAPPVNADVRKNLAPPEHGDELDAIFTRYHAACNLVKDREAEYTDTELVEALERCEQEAKAAIQHHYRSSGEVAEAAGGLDELLDGFRLGDNSPLNPEETEQLTQLIRAHEAQAVAAAERRLLERLNKSSKLMQTPFKPGSAYSGIYMRGAQDAHKVWHAQIDEELNRLNAQAGTEGRTE